MRVGIILIVTSFLILNLIGIFEARGGCSSARIDSGFGLIITLCTVCLNISHACFFYKTLIYILVFVPLKSKYIMYIYHLSRN